MINIARSSPSSSLTSSQPRRHRRGASPVRLRLAAGLFALGGIAGAALASPPEPAFGDGEATVAALSSPEALHYARQPLLIASDCVRLETQRHGTSTIVPVIANYCAYPVTVSYCIDGADSDNRACQSIARRKYDTRAVQPGASLLVEAENGDALNGEIDWVACRGSDKVFSSLFRDKGQTRGECLAPESAQQPAVQTAAAPVDAQR